MPVLESPPAAPAIREHLQRPASAVPIQGLGQQHQNLKFTLHRKLLDKINLDALASIETQKLRSEVRSALTQLMDAEQTLLSAVERNQIISEVLDEVFGLGPLEPLLQDPTVSDILVNTHSQVYVERKGKLELTDVTFKDNAHLYRIIDKIVSEVGRRIDESSPMVDARLRDGSRVNAIIPPLAVDGPLLSIRRFGTDKLLPADLVERQSMTQEMLQLLEASVKSRLNIIVAGGGPVPVRPPCSTRCRPSSRRESVSSPSKTPPNCSSSSLTWRAWKRGRPIWKAPAPSASGSC